MVVTNYFLFYFNYWLFNFVYICVSHTCAHVYAGGSTRACMHGDQRRTLSFLLYISQSYYLEAGPLTEPGMRLASSKIQWSSHVSSPQYWGHRPEPPFSGFYMGSKDSNSALHDSTSNFLTHWVFSKTPPTALWLDLRTTPHKREFISDCQTSQ